MAPPEFSILTAADRSDLRRLADEVTIPAWPEFMLQDPMAKRWPELYERFPRFQFALADAGGETLAVGNSIPLTWSGSAEDLPDTGWDWALERGLRDHEAGRDGTAVCAPALCALQVVVAACHRGKGISARAVRAMMDIATMHGLSALVAPVRPTLKSRYPLTPMESYVRWENEQGLPFDPWLRVHARLGAEIVKVCPQSMRITGSVADWEQWAAMRFPESGSYLVPGALVPVEIDCAEDVGVYVEPNVWMWHALPGDEPASP